MDTMEISKLLIELRYAKHYAEACYCACRAYEIKMGYRLRKSDKTYQALVRQHKIAEKAHRKLEYKYWQITKNLDIPYKGPGYERDKTKDYLITADCTFTPNTVEQLAELLQYCYCHYWQHHAKAPYLNCCVLILAESLDDLYNQFSNFPCHNLGGGVVVKQDGIILKEPQQILLNWGQNLQEE